MNKNYFYTEFLNEIFVAYFNAEKGHNILFDETVEEEWDEYQQWLNAGNSLQPYVAPPEPTPLTTEQKIARAGFDEGELEDFLVAKIQQRLNE